MRTILAALAILLFAAPARAYAVEPPRPLDDQAKDADLVCKATVASERTVTDPALPPVLGYVVREAELRVVSVIKGAPGPAIRFRHYALAPADGGMSSYSPAHIQFAAGATYLVLAMRDGAAYRQASLRGDLDIIAAADARPHHGKTLREAAWHELTAALDGPAAAAAIAWLDQLSGGDDRARSDFARADAIAAVRAHVLDKDPAVATAAIALVGHDSPYLHDGTIDLAAPRVAPDAKTAAALRTAADAGPVRALAIRGLGHAGAPAASLARWLADADPEVRAAAIELTAETRDRAAMIAGLADRAPVVRTAAALAIAFARDANLAPRIAPLLVDPAVAVRKDAARALLAFPTPQVARVLAANLTTQYRPLFINALAHHDPAAFLPELAEIITRQLQPTDWDGGTIPAGEAWSILFRHVARQPDLTHLGASLDALERMRWFSSSEPRDLYALYVRRGLRGRAAAFRATLRTTDGGLMVEQFLDEADRYPERFAPEP